MHNSEIAEKCSKNAYLKKEYIMPSTKKIIIQRIIIIIRIITIILMIMKRIIIIFGLVGLTFISGLYAYAG